MELKKLTGPETGLLTEESAVDWAGNGIDFYEDVVYGTGGGHDILLDLMVPQKKAEGLRPALIWIHGGGWSVLNKKHRPTYALVKLCQMGFVCASINYTLVPEAPFPAPIEDCKCAVRFLKAHAKELGIDPDRIGVWGESAGGHLAALVGASYNHPKLEGHGGWNEYSSKVAAVCDWYCGGDMTHFGGAESPQVQARARELNVRLTGFDNQEKMEQQRGLAIQLFGVPPKEASQLAMDISPIFYVAEKQPPYLLMHGDSDVNVSLDFSYNFYDALLSHGHDATFVIVARQGHGFFKGDGYYDIVCGFFQKHLRCTR